MHRFFVPIESFSAQFVTFPAETARQMRSVLRLRPGEQVIVLDNRGQACTVALEQVDAQAVRGRILTRGPAAGEPHTLLTLYLGLTQREKFELILQKCTEVGVLVFAPFISSRCLVTDLQETEKKRARWEKILQEAAEQSGRGRIPSLLPAMRFGQAVEHARRETGRALFAWESEPDTGLRSALGAPAQSPIRIGLFIGPEGGFSEEEAQQARAAGVQPLSLGPRILRMETAAIVAAALVIDALG